MTKAIKALKQPGRAAGRIGIGAAVAAAVNYYVAIPEGLREASTGVVILIVNELAYAWGLIWGRIIARIGGR